MVDIQQITQVKAVKASTFIRANNEYICQHYGTTILHVVPAKDNLEQIARGKRLKIVVINRASVTSSKMINRCLEYLNYPNEYRKAKEGELF